jgi:hypothetical protein
MTAPASDTAFQTGNLHSHSVLISARSAARQALRLRRRPSDGSFRSLRAWPGGGRTKAPRLASLRSAAAYRRRPWRARSPTQSPLTTGHRLPKPGTQSFQRRRARRLTARNSPDRRSNSGRPRTETEGAGLHNHADRPSDFGSQLCSCRCVGGHSRRPRSLAPSWA